MLTRFDPWEELDGLGLPPAKPAKAAKPGEKEANFSNFSSTLDEPWPAECLDAERRFGQRSARLFPLLGRRVSTPQGLGQLIQVLGSTAAIILDSEPQRPIFVRVVEVSPDG